MLKNVANQRVSFHATATAGGDVTTGTPTVYVEIDGGTQNAGGGTATHKGNGSWSYAPTQAETNGDHIAFTFVLSGAISQTLNVYTIDARVSSRSSHSAADAASAVRTNLATELARIDENVSAAKTLTTGERSALAGAIDLAVINQADGADLIGAIADAIAADWIAGDASPLAIVSALKADADWLTLIADAAAAKIAAQSAQSVTNKVDTALELDGVSGYQFTTRALENAPAGGGGGGTATLENQTEIIASIAALSAFDITRVGPGWDATTQTLTLVQGDDYLASKGRAISFSLSGIPFSLVGATAKVRATHKYFDPIVGTATVVDPAGTPSLRLEFTRAQLAKTPGVYQWDAEIIDADGDVATSFSGTLNLVESRTELVE